MITSPAANETLALPLVTVPEVDIRIGFGGGDLTSDPPLDARCLTSG
jgi:hypothetical protein